MRHRWPRPILLASIAWRPKKLLSNLFLSRWGRRGSRAAGLLTTESQELQPRNAKSKVSNLNILYLCWRLTFECSFRNHKGSDGGLTIEEPARVKLTLEERKTHFEIKTTKFCWIRRDKRDFITFWGKERKRLQPPIINWCDSNSKKNYCSC